jgi:hypothetical protein
MRILESVRKILKRPLGKILQPTALARLLKRERGKLIVVGDATGRRLAELGVIPAIWIYDGKEMRKKLKDKIPFPTHIAVNPPGAITESLKGAIDDSLKMKRARIFVQGEEDLATIYAIKAAPLSSVVVYGQPRKGIVYVKVDPKIKRWVRNLIPSL